MKNEALLSNVVKVSTAVGSSDLMKVSFMSKGDKHLCSIVAYDGAEMQFQSVMAYEGEGEKDGSYIVKASALIKALTLYKELGVEDITIKPEENSVLVGDGNGSITLQIVDKMTTLDEKSLNKGLKGMFVTALKPLQEAIKRAGIAIGHSSNASIYGVYFNLDMEAKEFTIFASDGFIGTRSAVTADVTIPEGGSAENMSFFALPAIVKAVAALKGDSVSAVVAEKYLILKDQENTLAIIKMSESKFPITMLTKTLVKRDAAITEGVDYSTVNLSAATLVAATELCSLSSADKDKVVKLNFSDDKFQISEKADKSARCIEEATVKVVDPTVLSKNYLVDVIRRTLRAVPTEKVTLRFTSRADLLFADGAAYPVAFMMPRK